LEFFDLFDQQFDHTFLIVAYLPSKSSLTIVGIIWGIIFLNKKLTLGMVVGLIVILISIFIISDIQIQPMLNRLKNKKIFDETSKHSL
jgi:hypothetical protein